MFNVPIALRIRGPLDPAVLVDALGDVVRRHEALRTVFADVDGVPWQRILTPEQARVSVRRGAVACEDLPGLLAAAARHVFDLAADVPIAAWLYEIGTQEHVFLVVMHHIAVDDLSMRPLFDDLSQAYIARTEGRDPRLAPPALQYADYAVWQRDLFGAESDPRSLAGRQISYWRSALAGIPDEICLPSAKPRPPVPSYRGDRIPVAVGAEVHAGLAMLSRRTGASMFMIVHTALVATLARLGAGTDIVVGAPVAGRTDAALDEMVGFFVNTAVLRTDCSGQPDLRMLLDRVREADLEAFGHQDVPFDHVVEALNPSRALARNPLFQVMLTVLTEDAALLRVPGLSCAEEHIDLWFSRYDMWFGLVESKSPAGDRAGITGDLRYSTDLFDASAMRDLVQVFVHVLRELAMDPSRPALPVAAPRTPAAVRRRTLPHGPAASCGGGAR